VRHGKIDIQQANLWDDYGAPSDQSGALSGRWTNQFRVPMNGLGNALAREGLIAETTLDVVEHLCMNRICLVQ
jgi:hypothetical protein